MANKLPDTIKLPLYEDEIRDAILKRDPDLLIGYLETFIKVLTKQFQEISQVVNQNRDGRNDA